MEGAAGAPVDLYAYSIRVASVYDGDTIRADIDLGFGTRLMNKSIRLHGINTPEVRGDSREAGLAARDRVRELILGAEGIVLHSIKDGAGKYGRYLGRIRMADGRVLNDVLLAEGHAVEYMK